MTAKLIMLLLLLCLADRIVTIMSKNRNELENGCLKIDKLKMNILYFVLLQNEAIYHKIEGGVGFGETRKKRTPNRNDHLINNTQLATLKIIYNKLSLDVFAWSI